MHIKGVGPVRRVVVDPIAPPLVNEPPPAREPQPNLYTSSLGQYAQLAQYIDTNFGNRDGVITVAELQSFIAAYGKDPRYHPGIVGIAMMLGCPTVQVNGQIALAQLNVQVTIGGGGAANNGVRYVQQQQAPPAGNDAWSIAQSLVRVTQGASRAASDEAIRSLASLPITVLRVLAKRGTRVIVASTITEYRPDLQLQKPRGWPPGSTWKQPAGMHDPSRNEIVLAHGGTSPRVVFHEVGHALDNARGFALSPSGTFLNSYNADYAQLQRNAEHYLLQPGAAGPSEAFAESHMWFQTNPQWLARAYPHLHAYWRWVALGGYREVGA